LHYLGMAFHWATQSRTNASLIGLLKEEAVVKSPVVESAMMRTDRSLYCKQHSCAYIDSPQEIGYDQTLSAPHMHAISLELLKDHVAKPAARVLDVGSGSGFLCACFARMMDDNGKVIGIDIVEPLVQWSIENLNRDDSLMLQSGKVEIKVADGWKGEPGNAPFDAIHVGAAADTVPRNLADQLRVGGRMIIPVGGPWHQKLMQIDKNADGSLKSKNISGVMFVPLVKQPQQK